MASCKTAQTHCHVRNTCGLWSMLTHNSPLYAVHFFLLPFSLILFRSADSLYAEKKYSTYITRERERERKTEFHEVNVHANQRQQNIDDGETPINTYSEKLVAPSLELNVVPMEFEVVFAERVPTYCSVMLYRNSMRRSVRA